MSTFLIAYVSTRTQAFDLAAMSTLTDGMHADLCQCSKVVFQHSCESTCTSIHAGVKGNDRVDIHAEKATIANSLRAGSFYLKC